MSEHQDDHRESVLQEPEHHLSESAPRETTEGVLNPRTIKLFSFMTMSICIVGRVFVGILAI